jgi:hypothetical protein
MKKPPLLADPLGPLVPDESDLALDLAASFRQAFAHTPLAGAVLGCGRAWRAAVRRAAHLEGAVRRHRDQRGDDRCWMDDEELYRALPEGYTPPARDSAVELKLCEQYIACRHNPATQYVSPQRRIEELEAELARLKAVLREALAACDSGHGVYQELYDFYRAAREALEESTP